MAAVQEQFREYHGRITPGFFDGEEPLREKRDAIEARLERNLSKTATSEEPEILALRIQGSYQTRTTVKKIDGEIDIDVGLYLGVDTDEFGPVTVKEWVYEALDGHTHCVEFRRHCIRVHYRRGFHVDIAVYAGGRPDGEESCLAVGKQYSGSEQREWKRSDPRRLHELIIERFSEKGRSQLRRTVRYLKRWSELRFRPVGNEAPTGIALTTAAYKYFEPKFSGPFGGGAPDDLEALRHLTGRLLDSFDGDEIHLQFPAEPHDDLFGEMSDCHQANFREELQGLKEALDKAHRSGDLNRACEILAEVFTEDFPVRGGAARTDSGFQPGDSLPSSRKTVGSAAIVAVLSVAMAPAFDSFAQKLKEALRDLRDEIRTRREEIKNLVRGAVRAAVLIVTVWLLASLLIDLVSD